MPEREPGHRRHHRRGHPAGIHEVAQPLLDKHAVARLGGIRIQAGEDQQANLAFATRLNAGAGTLPRHLESFFC